MTGYIRSIIVAVFLFNTALVSYAGEIPRDTQQRVKELQREKKAKRKKSLISAILLLNLVPPKKQILSSGNNLSVPDTFNLQASGKHDKYPLSFLQAPQNKKRAVEDLYKKYGFNDAVKWNLRSFSEHKYSFRKRLVRSGRYLKKMAGIFSEEGVPRELVFLPLIESEFNPYAYSQSKASGPWQFMPATAKNLDLKIDWWIDERRDPIKSTEAAAQYLKYLYEKFDSWDLVLAAYNAGEGRIDKVLKKVRKKDFWTIRRTRYITKETRNYVPSYIAATAIAMDPENFGFKNIHYQKPLKYDEVIIDNPMDLEVVGKFTGVRTWDIKELNPELRRLCTPPNVSNYTLRIPRGTKKMFMSNLNKTKGYEPYYVNFYLVKKGDTVEKIAMKLGSPIQTIIDMNSLSRRALIIAGESILVPLKRNWNRIISKTGF
jgi:membrane-bound lytic murein transglycosylase D